jgi:hypothetical protein
MSTKLENNMTGAVSTAFANAVYGETPGGLINSSNTVYTLANIPMLLQLFKNGIRLTNGVDYTISGLTITMTVAPTTSTDKLIADYFFD